TMIYVRSLTFYSFLAFKMQMIKTQSNGFMFVPKKINLTFIIIDHPSLSRSLSLSLSLSVSPIRAAHTHTHTHTHKHTHKHTHTHTHTHTQTHIQTLHI